MRFQSNAAFTKLAPDLIADAYDGFIGAFATTGANTETPLLAAPPAGSLNRIRSIAFWAPTTVAALITAGVRVLSPPNVFFFIIYPQANGTSAQWTGDVAVTQQINLYNNFVVTANASIWYRQEPIQP